MKRAIFLVTFILLTTCCYCQKYVLEKSDITFYSHAAIEDIKANNKKASSIFDAEKNEIVFAIPINQFRFKKSLMEEHFNEKYMDSEKYPKSTFQGTVFGFNKSSKGIQNVKANGKLTIHGVVKDVEIPGTIEVKDGRLIMKSKFMVKLEDYSITRPQLLWQNIAEEVEVTVEFLYKPQ